MFSSAHVPGSQLWCESLSKFIRESIDYDSQREYTEDDKRWHLGASEVGAPCSRSIWYSFRWATHKVWEGRMLRLFQRGHEEEPKFVHRLGRIGIHVWDKNPETGKQFRIQNKHNKHYGGSLDGIADVTFLPQEFRGMLCEFKTHSDTSFKAMARDGVRKSKPQHYGQMCAYGQNLGYHFGLYCAVNKNNDDIWPEVVPLDHKQGILLDEKALKIVNSATAPTRISENSASSHCKNCDHRGICHLGQPKAVSCRACKSVIATPDGEWFCSTYYCVLSRDLVKTGCQSFTPIE